MSISRMDKIIKMCFALILCLIFVANVSGISVSATKNTIQIKRSISGWSVPANSVKKSSTEMYLYPGDIVYFNFTYTPASISMSFGLRTPSNKFKLFNTDGSGIAKGAITITEEGIHRFRVRNNSSSYDATISGNYCTGCSYSFRSPYIAKKISQEYKSSHYGLDIVETTSGAIAKYPIYSINKGTVKVSKYSASAGYYAVVVGNNGYTVRYLHMDNSPSVSVDEQVNYSDLIGYVGKEGAGSTGYHLHIDVNTIGAYYGGDSSNNVNYDTTIDPQPLFPHIGFTY